MYENRDVIRVTDEGIAVVDRHTSLFMKARFTAGILVKEMREVTVCKTFGVFDTRHEAALAASKALTAKRRT